MSKSSGEFLTVSLLEEKGYDPLAYRFFCLQSHYRKALVFSWENLDNAATAYQKLIKKIAALKAGDGAVDEDAVRAYREKFIEQVGNDLNTAQGVTLLYDALKAKANDATRLAILGDFDRVMSLSLLDKARELRQKVVTLGPVHVNLTLGAQAGITIDGEGDSAVDAQVAQRAQAKKDKNFAEADRIRDELRAQGVEITDVPGGAVWRRV